MTINAKVILFDLDDTLVDRSATFSRYCSELIPMLLPDASDQKRQDIHRFMMSTDMNGHCDRHRLFSELVSRWNIPCDADALVRDWHDQLGTKAVPMPDLHAVLHRLAADYRLGIVTNGTVAMQNRKIDALGIRDYFGAIVISEEVGLRKPDERIFALACQALDAKPAETVFIGDNYLWDVEGPINAGLQAVWFNRGNATVAYQPCISSLSELCSG